MAGLLSRICTLEMTKVVAGLWATQMLADLGADVVEAEGPVLGDDPRRGKGPMDKESRGQFIRGFGVLHVNQRQ